MKNYIFLKVSLLYFYFYHNSLPQVTEETARDTYFYGCC